ncbi:hypothetical protein MA16_Dca015302 [Dendrobium catenatum]|uniref:Uncharacterized protein n=1 Tax=Dendrobium catenatum TaxID=906689 RepID=A0A2I0X045_9ASPA|nr:hypothetical protein MA16_Dca015302 [Dendrobium catenatum]
MGSNSKSPVNGSTFHGFLIDPAGNGKRNRGGKPNFLQLRICNSFSLQNLSFLLLFSLSFYYLSFGLRWVRQIRNGGLI